MSMDSESLIQKLAELGMPVFTTKDVAIISGKSASYAKVFLAGLVKRGVIDKVERGRYCLKGTSAYAIASRITKRSYVALISAAKFHRLTTQLPNTILVFSTDYHRPMRLKGGYAARFIKVSGAIMYGYKEYNGAYVSEIEKIFVDDVYYHKRLTYDEEFETAIARGVLDRERLLKYVSMLKNPKYEAMLRSALDTIKVKR
jgi:predicted transcriptional regulator of viral defense system